MRKFSNVFPVKLCKQCLRTATVFGPFWETSSPDPFAPVRGNSPQTRIPGVVTERLSCGRSLVVFFWGGSSAVWAWTPLVNAIDGYGCRTTFNPFATALFAIITRNRFKVFRTVRRTYTHVILYLSNAMHCIGQTITQQSVARFLGKMAELFVCQVCATATAAETIGNYYRRGSLKSSSSAHQMAYFHRLRNGR